MRFFIKFTSVSSKQDNRSLYFIAIIPDEPLLTELTELKKWMFKEFGTKAALRSPPHLTLLMPFKWKPQKDELIENSLTNLASSISSFNIDISNFNCFEPRVIYVDVVKNELLANLRNELVSLARKSWKLDFPKDLRGFNPHITIGFRDLKKPQFYKAWEQLKEKPFDATFKAKTMVLLKHNGKSWDKHRSFNLSPEILK